MQCPNCGASYDSRKLFCPECGALTPSSPKNAGSSPARTACASYSPAQSRRITSRRRKKRRFPIGILLIVLVLAAIIAVTVIVVSTCRRNASEEDTIQTESAVLQKPVFVAPETVSETLPQFPVSSGEAFSAEKYDDGLIRGNFSVFGTSLLGMTRQEAVAALRAAVENRHYSQDMTVAFPKTTRTLKLTPEQTGVQVDVEAIVEIAFSYGRADNGIAYDTEFNASEYISLDDAAICSAVYSSGIMGTTGPVSPKAYLDYSDVETETVSPEGETLVSVKRNPVLTVTLGTSGAEFSADAAVSAVKDAYGRGEFTAQVTDYRLIPAELPKAQVLYGRFCSLPTDAFYDPDTLEIMQEQSGWTFDKEELTKLLENGKEGETLSLPLREIPPEVTADQLEPRLTDVLGTFISRHTLNEGRTTNLILACEKINGKILQPGDTFSFNFVVGERTAEKGYRPAIAYVNSESVPEVGGGVCQVASAIYCACLYADLEILETHVHEFRPSYGNPGMDTTIFWDTGLDFKFRNNTLYPIRIDTDVSGGMVHCSIVGTETRKYSVKIRYELTETIPWSVRYHTVTEGETWYDGQVITSPYTGYVYVTYKDKYNADGVLLSSEEIRTSEYSKRDKVIARR